MAFERAEIARRLRVGVGVLVYMHGTAGCNGWEMGDGKKGRGWMDGLLALVP